MIAESRGSPSEGLLKETSVYKVIYQERSLWRVEHLGAEALILDSQEFPLSWSLSLRTSNSADFDFTLSQGNQLIQGQDVTAVWWRRPRAHMIDDAISDPRS